MKKYILALDQGTTSSRAIVFDYEGSVVSMAQKEFRQIFPEPGWVEHRPEEIWSSQAGVAAEALAGAGIPGASLAGTGITNQRETTIVWERSTGKPVYNAIVWQDRRTLERCSQLIKDGLSDMIRAKTGLVADAYFSASKLEWILQHVPGAKEKAGRGELAFGTVDSWLLWKMTGGKVHATDVSNASRTMLFNIHSLEWDADLLKLFGIPQNILPEVRSSSEVYGYAGELFASPVPVAGIAGDQQAALFGQMCIRPGMIKNTYGTGCFMMMNTGESPVRSDNRLLTTIAWKLGQKTVYALEGSVFIGGAVVQWLRDGLGLIRRSSDIEKLAAKVKDNGGVYFVPAFTGLGAPYWNQHARGTITGITRGTNASHIARAALESIAFQTRDVLNSMIKDSGIEIEDLRVDGGATVNDALMQIQADIIQTDVVRPAITETTALGTAYLAGLALGYWSGQEELSKQWKEERRFAPQIPAESADELITGWKRSMQAALGWAGNA